MAAIKIGASLSLLIVLLAYFYKKHSDDLIQERLRDVLDGLLRAERKIQPPKSKVKVALGFGGCEDIFVNGLALLNKLNLTAPDVGIHQNSVDNAEELTQLLAFFFPQGAAAE